MAERAKDNQEKNKNFALYFLFREAVAFNEETIRERIRGIEKDTVKITPIVGMDGADKDIYVHITIGKETFDLIGINAPLPENIVNYTVGCAYGSPEEIQEMREHGFHILVFYKGKNKNRQAIFDAYKKLAYGFLSQGLLGIANPYSWNVIGANLLQDMVEDEETSVFAKTPAMMIWRSFIKLPYEEGVWFVTKGNNLFGIHEYAYFGSLEEAQDIYDIFETVFSYIYEGEGTAGAGDMIQTGEEEFIRLKELDETNIGCKEALKGETTGTLVIEKVSKDETTQLNSIE